MEKKKSAKATRAISIRTLQKKVKALRETLDDLKRSVNGLEASGKSHLERAMKAEARLQEAQEAGEALTASVLDLAQNIKRMIEVSK